MTFKAITQAFDDVIATVLEANCFTNTGQFGLNRTAMTVKVSYVFNEPSM